MQIYCHQSYTTVLKKVFKNKSILKTNTLYIIKITKQIK